MTEIFAKELFNYYLTFEIKNPKINLELFTLFTKKLNISNKEDLINVPNTNIKVEFLGNQFSGCMKDIRFILKQKKYEKITFLGYSKLHNSLTNEQNIIYNHFEKISKGKLRVHGLREFIIDNNIINLEFFNDKINIQNLIINIEKESYRKTLLRLINIYYISIKSKKIINKRCVNTKNKELPDCMTQFIDKYNNFNNIIHFINNHYKAKNLSKKTYINYLTIIYTFNKMIFEKDIVFHEINTKNLINLYIERKANICQIASICLLFLLNLLIENNFFTNIINKISLTDINISKPELINFNVDIDESKKDYFSDDELIKIKEESKKIIEDELIIILLSHFGFRIGGLRNIHINNIYDFEKNELKDTGKTIEKGNKIRYFNITLDYELSDCLMRFLNKNPYILQNKTFLFYSSYSDSNISDTMMRQKIKKICEKAGITGPHVHPHAFRKTVVINLMKLGNSIDTVSKFIGHSSPDTTRNSYWVETQSDLTDNMIIPWIRTSKNVITLKDIGKLTKDVNIETVSEKSGVSKDFLYFIQDVYQPLKINVIYWKKNYY